MMKGPAQATARDVSFYIAISINVLALIIDVLPPRRWHMALLCTNLLFALFTMRHVFARLDRFLDERIGHAKADRQMAETALNHVQQSIAAGDVRIVRH